MAAAGNAGTIEADNAAADAAREARDEVIKKVPKPAATAKAKPLVAKSERWDEFQVDVWITNFNSIEFGFWKKDRNKAKSRQFTSDMDIFAEVTEGGEQTGLLGYREELWTKATGMDKRLVFKLFGEKAELARDHGFDARPFAAADARCAWRARDGILDQHQRPHADGLHRALGL